MIFYNNVLTDPDQVNFTIFGDGTTTSVSFDLTKKPFSLTFDTLPTRLMGELQNGDSTVTFDTVSLTLDGSGHPILAITFPSAPVSGLSNVQILMAYPAS